MVDFGVLILMIPLIPPLGVHPARGNLFLGEAFDFGDAAGNQQSLGLVLSAWAPGLGRPFWVGMIRL